MQPLCVCITGLGLILVSNSVNALRVPGISYKKTKLGYMPVEMQVLRYPFNFAMDEFLLAMEQSLTDAGYTDEEIEDFVPSKVKPPTREVVHLIAHNYIRKTPTAHVGVYGQVNDTESQQAIRMHFLGDRLAAQETRYIPTAYTSAPGTRDVMSRMQERNSEEWVTLTGDVPLGCIVEKLHDIPVRACERYNNT